MNRETAETIQQMLNVVFRTVNEFLFDHALMQPNDEFRHIKLAAGRLLGYMYLDIMEPIYEEHPDVKPRELIPPGAPL